MAHIIMSFEVPDNGCDGCTYHTSHDEFGFCYLFGCRADNSIRVDQCLDAEIMSKAMPFGACYEQ
jgi:hypothetical protein